MELARIVALTVAGGVLLTLVSGLVQLRTLLGATHYGYPMAWLIRLVLGPDQFPWRVNVVGLAADVIAWGFVVFVLLVFYDRMRR